MAVGGAIHALFGVICGLEGRTRGAAKGRRRPVDGVGKTMQLQRPQHQHQLQLRLQLRPRPEYQCQCRLAREAGERGGRCKDDFKLKLKQNLWLQPSREMLNAWRRGHFTPTGTLQLQPRQATWRARKVKAFGEG